MNIVLNSLHWTCFFSERGLDDLCACSLHNTFYGKHLEVLAQETDNLSKMSSCRVFAAFLEFPNYLSVKFVVAPFFWQMTHLFQFIFSCFVSDNSDNFSSFMIITMQSRHTATEESKESEELCGCRHEIKSEIQNKLIKDNTFGIKILSYSPSLFPSSCFKIIRRECSVTCIVITIKVAILKESKTNILTFKYLILSTHFFNNIT